MKEIINFDMEEKTKKKINKKKLGILIAIIIIALVIIVIGIAYSSDKSARKYLDKYLFRKNISEEKLVSISLDYDSDVYTFAYNKNICIVAENKLRQYNQSGELASEIKLEINNPIYCINNRYLAISEKNNSKLYLISGSKILWEKDVDGNIAKVDVNESGYVSIVLTGTTYKSVIVTYDTKGNELFKTYRATTTVMDSTISADNKYLAFAEINTTGTLIQSNIKIISIEKAIENTSEPVIYTYTAPVGSIVTNIKYQGKTKLICIYDDSIHCIENEQDEVIMNLNEENKKINAADINLNHHVYRAVEKSTGLFNADTMIEIINTENKKETIYTSEGVAKDIECYQNIIAINLGQEVEFINTNGWLIKSYTSTQDVQGIIIGNGIAGIIYKDKVEIINL